MVKIYEIKKTESNNLVLFFVEDEGLEPTHPFTDVRFSKPLHYHSANLPKKNLGLVSQDFSGGLGIRTPGCLSTSSVFKTDAIDHSAKPPYFCTPDRIRTCDLRFRKPLLYPAELQGHVL
jgi:hypothetical protein